MEWFRSRDQAGLMSRAGEICTFLSRCGNGGLFGRPSKGKDEPWTTRTKRRKKGTCAGNLSKETFLRVSLYHSISLSGSTHEPCLRGKHGQYQQGSAKIPPGTSSSPFCCAKTAVTDARLAPAGRIPFYPGSSWLALPSQDISGGRGISLRLSPHLWRGVKGSPSEPI